MSFANPLAWSWALLAVPVVIFYVLKIRLKRVPVSTVIFWRQLFDEKKPRSLWQRLRHLISLLVQLALLALMVVALTEPFLPWEAFNARRIILVLDNSASMNATDIEPSRLSKAKDEARQVIQGMRYRDEMAIVSAGAQPRVVCGLTSHQKTLRDFIGGIEPTDGPTLLPDAVAIAQRLAADSSGQGKTQIVIITDGCHEAARKLAEAENTTLIAVGKRTANVAITRFQVRRSTIDPIGYETLVEVTNFGDEPTGDFRLSIALNGGAVDIKPLNLAANAKWSEVLENTTADGGLLTAELTVKGEKGDQPFHDALVADNKASAVLPKREPMPVHMHSPPGNLFLQKVLEANPLVRLTTSKELPKEFPSGSVKVFHREVPAKLPPGPILVVDPANGCDLWTVGDKLQSPIVTYQDKDSPLMAHVRLDNVLMPEAHKLTFIGKPQVLASAVTGDPLFALIPRPEGPVVILTVNLDLGDLPFRTAFPILAMNTLGYFTGAGELFESLPTGATAEVTLVPANDHELRAPNGSTRKLPTGVEKATVGPFDQVGVWAVLTNNPSFSPIKEYAVNLMNKAESDLRPPEGLPETTAKQAGLSGGFLGRPTWWYLVGLAWALAATEWYLYQRRWIS